MNGIQISSPCQHNLPNSSPEFACQQILICKYLNSIYDWKILFENIPVHLQSLTYFFIENLVKHKKLKIAQITLASKFKKARETMNIQVKTLLQMGIICVEKGGWKVSNTYHLHQDLYNPEIQAALKALVPAFAHQSLVDLTLLRSYKGRNSLSYLLNNYSSPKEAFQAMGISEKLVKVGLFFGLEFQDMLKLAAFPLEALSWAYEKFALNSRLAKWKPPKERRKAFYFRKKTLIRKPLNWLVAMCMLFCQWNDFVPNWQTHYKLVDVQNDLIQFHSYFSRSSAARSPKMTKTQLPNLSPYKPFIAPKVVKEDPTIHNNKLLERYNNDPEWRNALTILGISIDKLLNPTR